LNREVVDIDTSASTARHQFIAFSNSIESTDFITGARDELSPGVFGKQVTVHS
jgi:hypothetical protein